MKINKAFSFSRNLGFPLFFDNTSVDGLIKNKKNILLEIENHGCVCLKNIDFQPPEMVQFTKRFWDEAITLPSYLAFNNQDQSLKQVARVGNVKLDGTLKDSQKQAAYWHQDGNFWGEEKKHIYNCLHTRQQPEQGGDTHVMDLVQGARFLKQIKPEVYEKILSLIGVLNLENINDFKLYNAKNTLGIQTVTKHRLLKSFGKQGLEVLFLSVHELRNMEALNSSQEMKINQLHELLQNQMGFYAHKWERGDMLIWDNLQVMHRSSGSFKGRRLLFRTQGRFNK